MATIRAFTTIEQSKKLAEFLPLETADMCYSNDGTAIKIDANPYTVRYSMWKDCVVEIIPCWSLAALIDIIKTYSSRLEIALRADKNYNIFAVSGDFVFRSFDECSEGYNNPIDACVAMIENLHELKML